MICDINILRNTYTCATLTDGNLFNELLRRFLSARIIQKGRRSVKRKMYFMAMCIVVSTIALDASFGVTRMHAAKASGTCTPTGFVRDSINLTAALINP